MHLRQNVRHRGQRRGEGFKVAVHTGVRGAVGQRAEQQGHRVKGHRVKGTGGQQHKGNGIEATGLLAGSCAALAVPSPQVTSPA